MIIALELGQKKLLLTVITITDHACPVNKCYNPSSMFGAGIGSSLISTVAQGIHLFHLYHVYYYCLEYCTLLKYKQSIKGYNQKYRLYFVPEKVAPSVSKLYTEFLLTDKGKFACFNY